LTDDIKAREDVKVTAVTEDGKEINFTTNSRIDTPVEVDYYRNGGILHTVLLDYLKKSKN
jgi:aconitate hydratase